MRNDVQNLEVGADAANHRVTLLVSAMSPQTALCLANVLTEAAYVAHSGREPDNDGFEIRKIEIDFALPVTMTERIQRELGAIVDRMVRETESETVVHWAAGRGSKPIWNEPHEPTWDASVYQIETATRERYPTDAPYKKPE